MPVADCPPVTTGGDAATLIIMVMATAGEVPLALVAVKIGVNVPVAVGVPESNPVLVLSVTPEGSAPDEREKEVGLLLAATV